MSAALDLAGELAAIRESYDTVAADYADLLRSNLAGQPHERAVLGLFAELVSAAGGGAVADVGCGPGRITAALHGLGLDAFGLDLSPAMIQIARHDHPGLRPGGVLVLAFQVGDESRLKTSGYGGHPMRLHVHLRPPERVEAWLRAAGFAVDTRLVREPVEGETVPQAYLLARKPCARRARFPR